MLLFWSPGMLASTQTFLMDMMVAVCLVSGLGHFSLSS